MCKKATTSAPSRSPRRRRRHRLPVVPLRRARRNRQPWLLAKRLKKRDLTRAGSVRDIQSFGTSPPDPSTEEQGISLILARVLMSISTGSRRTRAVRSDEDTIDKPPQRFASSFSRRCRSSPMFISTIQRVALQLRDLGPVPLWTQRMAQGLCRFSRSQEGCSQLPPARPVPVAKIADL